MTDTTIQPNDVLAAVLDLRSRYKATLAALLTPLLGTATGGTANADGTGGPGPYYQVPDLDGAMHGVSSLALNKVGIYAALGLNPSPGFYQPNGDAWPFLPIVGPDGVMEVGRFVDLHHTSADGIDYSVRIFIDDAGNLEIYGAGTVAIPGDLTAGNRLRVFNSTTPILDFIAQNAGVDQKTWRWAVNQGGELLRVDLINDAYTAVISTPLTISRDGYLGCAGGVKAGGHFYQHGGDAAYDHQNTSAPAGLQSWRTWVDPNGGNWAVQMLNDAFTAVLATPLYFSRNGPTTAYGATSMFVNALNIVPTNDNAMSIGASSNRFSQAFVVSGAINTSDAREKTVRGPLNDAELRVARRCATLARVYQWNTAIAEKTAERARLHISPIAQDVRDAFAAEGLDGRRYGVLCYDEWVETPAVAAIMATPPTPAVLDDEGHELAPAIAGRPAVAAQPAIPAGDRWGIRPDQFNTFVSAGQEQAIADQEQRLAALEAKLQGAS